jgi:hypothetical protein
MRHSASNLTLVNTAYASSICWIVLGVTMLATPSGATAQEFTEAIEDNSFFIEEAYNQERGVVQHISSLYFQRETKDYGYSFTQEWPAGGQTHQLSYTVPYLFLQSGQCGIGDLSINYRYQMWDEGNWAWVSPRLTVFLPTGRSSEGLGSGVVGVQLCLPLSKRWSNGFVSHFNAGVTILADAHTSNSFFFGASGIWLLTQNLNFMCEVLHSINSEIDESGNVAHTSQTIVSPGMRCAINLGELQIVPGVALPLTGSEGRFTLNAFAYLSFEHPL